MYNRKLKLVAFCLLLSLMIASTAIFSMAADLGTPSDGDNQTTLKLKNDVKCTQLNEGFSTKEIYEDNIQKEKAIQDEMSNSYIVKFKDSTTPEKANSILGTMKLKSIGTKDKRLYLVKGKKAADELIKNEAVEYVEANSKVYLERVPNDTFYPLQWNVNTVNATECWDVTTGSYSVKVAVIDSGLFYEHPDLDPYGIYVGWNYIFDEPDDYDSATHGTNVTGIIAAETNNGMGLAGFNWDVSIKPLHCFIYDGSGLVSDIIEAIYDAVDLFGCKIINLSSGGPSYIQAYKDAVDYAASKGVIVVAAAGNDGTSEIMYPAGYDNAIGVGSINESLNKSDFSQYNSSVFVTAPGEYVPTLCNPYIHESLPLYMYADGTSFSAPHVSALAALIASVNPNINVGQFKNILTLPQ